jgi:signal transduction histidine kinase/DNA-binding NarL/FixJ family response regulator
MYDYYHLVGGAPVLDLDERIERRYVGLARLARSVSVAADYTQVAAAIGAAIADPLDEGHAPSVRLWAITADGIEELARHSAGDLPHLSQRDLQRAAVLSEPTVASDGRLLVGLHAGGMTLGVLEVEELGADADLVADAAPVVACAVGLIAGQGAGDVLPAPVSVEGASDVASLMATFAAEAKHLLDHDRLSAYLLTADGRAFERFAVATSPIVPGEGVIIPFEDVGLRHIVITNRPLVSADLGSDPRIVGREDRVIARAGFHGLLSVPLRQSGRPFGVLNFVSRTPGFYGESDVPIAQQVADQVAGFIGNLRAQERMRTLVRHEAAESERARVARDVYHAVAQTAPAIEAIAGALQQRLAASDQRGSEEARRVRDLVRLELADVRRVVANMVPRGLDSQSLSEAMESWLGGMGNDAGARLTVEGDTAALSGAVKRGSYRIFQEAITNARVHAVASAIDVTLRVDRDLELVVEDDGCGFDPETAACRGGTGIQLMRERAQALGGTLSVVSSPGSGTTVTFHLLGVRDTTEESPAMAPDDPLAPATVPVSLRVFITHPGALTRAGLVALLERADGIRVVGEAESGEETRGRIRRLHPDIVIVDGQLPEDDLERTIADIKTALRGCAVLVLADYEPERDVQLREHGASGVLPRTISAQELVDTLMLVARGGHVHSFPSPAGQVAGTRLSSRERSVLALMSAGYTNAEIGSTLFLATKTVERQVATIIRKLGARNRAHAGALAVARHLVEPGQLDR